MNIAYKLVRTADKILNFVIYFCLIVVFIFCLYALFDTIKIYFNASSNNVSVLKPSVEDPQESLKSLKAINEDICGWITIDDTNIDYPIVRGANNQEYLSKDVYKNYSLSGSIFLDYRNSMDFSDKKSVIFGHHMSGGAMFGDIQNFADSEYFSSHTTGYLYTEDGVYTLRIYAFLATDAYDSYIYSMIDNQTDENQEKILEYIKEHASRYRDVGVTIDDRIICLSTCSTATTNGRYVLVAKIEENEN